MLKVLFIASTVLISASTLAATANIHNLKSGGGTLSTIDLTNACNTVDVTATVKLWSSAGSLLTNQQITSTLITDSNGEIDFQLSPHQSVEIYIHSNYFPSNVVNRFNGTVTSSYNQTGEECLIGGYNITTHNAMSSNYLINSGNKF